MAITLLLTRDHIDATADHLKLKAEFVLFYDQNGFNPEKDCLVTFGTGRVLNERERNGYDDSDFYCDYIDDEGMYRSFQYATTRGWTYANSANVDADEATLAIYTAMLKRRAEITAYENRKQAIVSRLTVRKARRTSKVSIGQFKRLRAAVGGSMAIKLVMLLLKLTEKRLRSPFRISMANQVRGWLDTTTPKYATPLSRKQLDCIGD
jgi:hypothetical protein